MLRLFLKNTFDVPLLGGLKQKSGHLVLSKAMFSIINLGTATRNVDKNEGKLIISLPGCALVEDEKI